MDAVKTSQASAQEVRGVLGLWAETTRKGLLDQVLAHHADNALIYDVLPPLRYEGTRAYRESWADWHPETPDDGQFEWKDLVVTADDSLAFAHGLIQCGGTLPNGKVFTDLVRATFCLQKQHSHWNVVHQHISKPWATGG